MNVIPYPCPSLIWCLIVKQVQESIQKRKCNCKKHANIRLFKLWDNFQLDSVFLFFFFLSYCHLLFFSLSYHHHFFRVSTADTPWLLLWYKTKKDKYLVTGLACWKCTILFKYILNLLVLTLTKMNYLKLRTSGRKGSILCFPRISSATIVLTL